MPKKPKELEAEGLGVQKSDGLSQALYTPGQTR